ncbi:MAG: hypothetical protein KGJ90_03895 [Patescibacteria group bacterium]|nr:hypothetical protein [Patescibacteria group bacterium]
MLPEDEKLLRLAEAAHLPWMQTHDIKYGPALWNSLREFMARWEATLERSVVPARWQAEIEYAQCAANALPKALKRIDALRDFLRALLALHGPHIDGICTDCNAAKRMLEEDEAAAKEQVPS